MVVNPDTGEMRQAQAQVFVAVLGASNYIFAYASWCQKPEDWLRAHLQDFEFFGGIPELVVPDYVSVHIIMLEHYFAKPDTIDTIRASWVGEPIEQYVSWLAGHG